MDYRFLLDLAIILVATKTLGLVMKRLGLPQVVGALLAGILVGPALWGPMTGGRFIPVRSTEFLTFLAELGVILIMFGAGLETDLGELKRSGLKASFVALAGVLVPLALGFGIAVPFFGLHSTHDALKCVFIGVIITATSVSITVETLRELGKLKGRVGTVVLSAAIIDDVIGIIILSVLTGFSSGSGSDAGWKWFSPNAGLVVIKIVIFFIVAIALGVGLRKLFNIIERKAPHNRRVPIISLAACFLYAYCAEKFFGVADITGAYVAGIMLGGTLSETPYVESKVDQMGYLFFSPVFFANIGIANIDYFSRIDVTFLAFGAVFVIAALLGKLLGCGACAKLCKFKWNDSFRVGLGMMVRAEVVLICTQKGVDCGLVNPAVYPFIICIILLSSVLTPILLKWSYRREEKKSGKLPPSNDGTTESVKGE